MEKKKNGNIIYIYVLLINIYLLQYLFKVYSLNYNDKIRYYIVFIISLLFVYMFIRYIMMNLVIPYIVIVFLTYLFYVFFINFFTGKFNTSVLIESGFFPLLFLLSYFIFDTYFEKRTMENIIIIFNIFFVVYFSLYIYEIFFVRNRSGMIINSIYYQLLITPFFLLNRNYKIKVIFLLMLSFSVLVSQKRTAFISLFIIIIYYLFFNINKRKKFNYKKLLVFIFCLFIFIFMNNILKENFKFNILYRFSSLSTDKGSGRLTLILEIINQLKKNTIIDSLIGHGIFTSGKYTSIGVESHNDFVEMLWSYGIIGFILYLGIYIFLIKQIKIFKQSKFYFQPIYTVSIIIFFILSLFSQLIFIPTYMVYLSIFWSYCIVLSREKEL